MPMPSHDDCNQCSAQPKPPRHLRHLELCRKLRLLGLCLFSVIRHGGRRDRREKPGIEEQHNTLRLTRIPRDRGQRFFSLRSNEVSTESGSDRVSPRSGRRYKAWGASPRIKSPTIEPAEGVCRKKAIGLTDSACGQVQCHLFKSTFQPNAIAALVSLLQLYEGDCPVR